MTEQPGQQDTKKALLEARQLAMEAARGAAEEAPRKSGRQWLLPLTFLATLAFGVYLLLASPAWFRAPPLPPESTAVSEASLRIAMWQQAIRVRNYQERHDRPPNTLSEAGAPLIEGIEYQELADGEWVIEGRNGTLELTLRSDESFDTFLGNSVAIVSRRGDS